jgi:integrase
VQQSTGTKRKVDAMRYHDMLKAASWKVEKLGAKPRRLWQEAMLRWLEETSHKASQAEDKRYLRWLRQFLDGKYLDEITRDDIDEIARIRKAQGVSNATVNRTIQVVRAILRRAALDWEWIEKVPKIRFLPEPKRRVRFLTKSEAQRLLDALPEHLAEMARFTLATGLREANVVNLEWSQVNLEQRLAWIHHDQAKARKPIGVPLNDGAMTVLQRQVGKHPERVFTFRGKPIKHKAGGNAWRRALKKADIGDFRWHDLRHTWASWHAQAGTPLHVLQELGAWESVEMVQRYAHLAAHHLQEHAQRLDTTPAATVLLQSPEEGHVSH